MKRVLGLGITNPITRVFVWLLGCCSCSAVGAVVGAVAGVLLMIVLAGLVVVRTNA